MVICSLLKFGDDNKVLDSLSVILNRTVENLFKTSQKFVLIFAVNTDDHVSRPAPEHVRTRRFTEYIKSRFRCWTRMANTTG